MVDDEYYYQIELTNKKLIFYFVAGAFALILSFLAGVMVGRGVEGPRGMTASEQARLDERIVPEAGSAEPSPTTTPEDLTYSQRLESDKPDNSLAEPPPTTMPPAPKPRTTPAALPTPAARPAPTERPIEAATPRALPTAVAARPSPLPAAESTPAAETTRVGVGSGSLTERTATPSSARGRPRQRHMTVQVGAFQDRSAAESVAAQLKGKGFPAYVSPGGVAGLFNVRVGTFDVRSAAEKVKEDLRAERFTPFIVVVEN